MNPPPNVADSLILGSFKVERVSDGTFRIANVHIGSKLHYGVLAGVYVICGVFIVPITIYADDWKMWLGIFIPVLVARGLPVFQDITIDKQQRMAIKRARILGQLPVSRRTWRANDQDRVALFTESDENSRYTYVFITRDRTRFRVIGRRIFKKDSDSDLENILQLVAQLLQIEYREYAKKGEFYWW